MDGQGNGYIYGPLNTSEDIRLVILEPLTESASLDRPISCKFIHVRFADRPVYQALSYTWGESTERRMILVEGQVMAVTKNLWSALSGLRLHDLMRNVSKPRRIWIDALCINQQDIQERNHQVQLMRQIYSQAEEVLTWLGPTGCIGSLALEVLEGLNETLQHKDLNSQHWQALEPLTSLEYFYRMWIVQEVVLAQRIIIHCGTQSVDWSKLSMLFTYIDSPESLQEQQASNIPYIEKFKISQAMTLDRNRKSFHSRTLSLKTLLRVCASCKCADPRDKVFALLGIARDCQNNELVPDYSKDLFRVYLDVMDFWNPHVGATNAYPKAIVLSQTLQRSFANPDLLEECAREHRTRDRCPLFFKFKGTYESRITSVGPIYNRAAASFDLIGHLGEQLKRHLEGVAKVSSQISTASIHPSSVQWIVRDRLHTLLTSQSHTGKNLNYNMNEDLALRIFYTSNGEYGFGPSCIRLGDSVSQILNSDISVIIRASLSGFYHIIGRVVLFKERSWFAFSLWKHPNFKNVRNWMSKMEGGDSSKKYVIADLLSFS